MKLTDSYELRKSGQGFALVELVPYKNKDGVEKIKENTREFGTVYQALQCFIDVNFDMKTPLMDSVKLSVKALEMHKDKIKDNFRVEVRITK